MTNGELAILPGVIALFVTLRWSVRTAFLTVYLPSLLLLPDYFHWVSPYFPEPSFAQMAILPIGMIYLLKDGKRWRLSLTDLLVVGFALSVGYAQMVNSTYKDAQNLFFDMITHVMMPYMLTKSLLCDHGERVTFAKQFVLLLCIVAIANVYESRMTNSFFRAAFIPYFPAYQAQWGTFSRWGLGRAAGPFGHAILAGIFLGAGLLVQLWLARAGHWPSRRLALTVLFVLLLGLGLTLSRGPWVAAVIGMAVVVSGFARYRISVFIVIFSLGFVIASPVYSGFLDYITIEKGEEQSFIQRTAAYRRQLWLRYPEVIMQSALWGYGQDKFPKLPDLPSIDNHWLLVALNHGLVTLGFFLGIIFWTTARLFFFGMRAPPLSQNATLSFTLLGIYVLIAIAITTVYMGLQCVPLFFLITGWSESLLLRPCKAEVESEGIMEETPFSFRRVLA